MATIVKLAGQGQVIGNPMLMTASLEDDGIVLDVDSISAGLVTLRVINDGSTAHELMILQTDDTAAEIIADAIEDEAIVVSGYTVVGNSNSLPADVELTMFANLAEGHYVFISNIPGDVFLGLAVDFTVTAAVSDFPRFVNAIGRVARRARIARGTREVKTPSSTWRIFK